MHIIVWLFIALLHEGVSLKEPSCKNLRHHKNFGAILPFSDCLPIDSTKKIMGGMDANLGEFPWIAAIYLGKPRIGVGSNMFWCTGSIINSKYILTAAHCIQAKLILKYSMFVRVGEHNMVTEPDCDEWGDECAPTPRDFDVEKFIVYPGYSIIINHNDIALIRISGEIHFNDYVYPVCLPTTCNLLYANMMGQYLTLAGFGALEDEPKPVDTKILQKVDLKVVPPEVCNQDYGMELLQSQICLGGSEEGDLGKDSCHGDSGGPLMFPSNLNGPPAKYVLVGTVSGGQNCNVSATSQGAGLYTRVASYMPWILDNIEE